MKKKRGVERSIVYKRKYGIFLVYIVESENRLDSRRPIKNS
jgi:hypothetical protein